MLRFYEILPGALAWFTIFGLAFLSWQLPAIVAVFIVLFDLYWLLKTIYLFFHLRFSYSLLKKNLKINWLEKLKDLGKEWENVHHLVILPTYKESYELIRQSFNGLASTNFPKEKLFVVLAVEERSGEEGLKKAKLLEAEFGKTFKNFLVTIHPADLPNEIPGKGSNETWAAREALKKVINPLKIPYENIIASVFDIDTRPGPDYFGLLTYKFLTAEKPQNSSYQPIPIFTNNIHQVPAFARLTAFTSTFWQLMQQSRPEQLVTFSSHSAPLKALVEVGFWQTDIVSEDSRIFYQLLNHYNGDWRVVPLYYPVYMDAVSGENFWEAFKNLYKQQRRWAWGSENIPYLMSNFLKNKKAPLRKKFFWPYIMLEGFHSWATSSFIIFLFGFLPNVIGGAGFQTSLLSYNLPKLTGFLMNLGIIGIVTSAFLSILLLPPRLSGSRFYHYLLYFIQWFLMPITILVFAGLPALDAETRLMLGGRFRLGFWLTPKAR